MVLVMNCETDCGIALVDPVERVVFGVVAVVVERTVFRVDKNRPVLAAFARTLELKGHSLISFIEHRLVK